METTDGFNASHTLAYSLIALQEMNLAYKYPIIFWNCACLINDSGGAEKKEEDDLDGEISEEAIWDSSNELSMVDFSDDEDEEEDDDDDDTDSEDIPMKTKKKKKAKSINYGKIASAIGKIQFTGTVLSLPNINSSLYTFAPDVATNSIKCGLSGITGIGEDVVKEIIENRPYTGINDFISKVKVKKPQVINLIKCGAFDDFGDRVELMKQYADSISDTKTKLNLQNAKMLFDKEIIPDEYSFHKRVYNFNKYLKKNKSGDNYILDDIAFNFYEANFSIDSLIQIDNGYKAINQKVWDKQYNKIMDDIRKLIKDNQQEMLDQLNSMLIEKTWKKYCTGNISKWEMDSISFYFHEHELSTVNNRKYGFSNFEDLPEEPIIDNIIQIKGKQIPLYKISRIIGTVVHKDKAKKTVTLLTTGGIVTVHIYGNVFNFYDKQISQKTPEGKKKVVEKSYFSRGNKIIVTGIRRGDDFIAKKYSKTPYHLVELITDIDGENIKITSRSDEN